MEGIDVDSLDNFSTYREFWEGNNKRDLRKDNGKRMKVTKKEASPEWLIIGEAIDIDDERNSEEENPQEAENDTKDQLCEDSDNGNDTDALVKGLGYSRADFLEKWNKLSKTAHNSVEWRKNHPNPCAGCKRTSCEFANSETLSCIKCTKERRACSVRIDCIADKMAQLQGSKKWISRAVARDWHKNRRTKSTKYPDGTWPRPVKSSPKKMHEKLPIVLQNPNSTTPAHVSLFTEKSKPGKDLALPAERQAFDRTPSILEVEDKLKGSREIHVECATVSNFDQGCGKVGEIWASEQEIVRGRGQLRNESRGYERQQESSTDGNYTTTTDGTRYESRMSVLPFVSQMVKAAVVEKGVDETYGKIDSLRTRQSVGTLENNGWSLKAMRRRGDSERQGEEEEDATNMARKMKQAENTIDGERKKLNPIKFIVGGVEAHSAQNSGGTAYTQNRKDAGPPVTHRVKSQVAGFSLYCRMDGTRQKELHKEALGKGNLKYSIESKNVQSAAQATLVKAKAMESGSTAKDIHEGSRSKPVDSSITWWRSAALFNQLQINLMEHERFTLSRGLGEFLERLRSLRDEAASSPELHPLLRHELNVITESLTSLHGNEQSSDIRQSRNRLLFPDKNYLDSDAEALERQIRHFEEIRHDTRDSEASRSFSWIDLGWQLILDGKSPLRKRTRHDDSDTDDLPPAKRHDRNFQNRKQRQWAA